MRITGAMLVAALVLTSAACYESAEPLSKPGDPIDQALLGDWDCKAPGPDDELILFRVRRFDNLQYYVETAEKDGHTNRYQVYATGVGGRTLLNARDLEQKSPPDRWFFLRYALDGRDRMSFWVIPEEAMKGVEPGQAMATIRRRVTDDAIYRKVADCRRR